MRFCLHLFLLEKHNPFLEISTSSLCARLIGLLIKHFNLPQLRDGNLIKSRLISICSKVLLLEPNKTRTELSYDGQVPPTPCFLPQALLSCADYSACFCDPI